MTNEDWKEAWRLFELARGLEPAARRSLLGGTSPHIVDEVEAMVDAAEDADLEEPPAPGRDYGKYTLVAALGSGGMGEVFSARDRELGRMVAIKFVGARSRLLPAARQRLVHEAQAASALDHPNLVTVHEVLRFESGVAIVTELVKGQSLRAFAGAAVPIQQVAVWGAQIAHALAAAHAESIVHSDIKPENVMLRDDGYIKILDFGLARDVGLGLSVDNLTLGTVGYMSPEQTRGEALTGASDVFSLGVMLLELATGTHPFLAKTTTAATIAITQSEVNYPAPPVPGGKAFAALLGAMLDKAPDRRPFMADAARALERVVALQARRIRGRVVWGAGAVAAIGAAIAAILIWNRPADERVATRVAPLTNYSGSETEPAFSPDGTKLAFAWTGETGVNRDVYVKRVPDGDAARFTPGDANYHAPAWSPDGQQIAMLRGVRGSSQDVVIVAAEGGEPRLVGRIADTQGFKRTVGWWPDGKSLLVRDAVAGGIRLVRLSLSAAAPQAMTAPPPTEQDAFVTPSPDGARIAFARLGGVKAAVCLLRADGRPQEAGVDPCIHRPSSVAGLAWEADGKALLLADGSALWRLALDGDRVKRAARIAEGNFAALAADPRGSRLAFARTLSDMNMWRTDRDGRQPRQIAPSSAEDSEPRFSPDGAKLVFRSLRTGALELWVADSDGSHPVQLTSTAGHLGSAQWSPDGTTTRVRRQSLHAGTV